MSDGPHKSLPMRPGWKDVAERADNERFEQEDVDNALAVAVEQDWRRDILPIIASIRNEINEAMLFVEYTAESLESIYSKTSRSAMGDALLGHLILLVNDGKSGEIALKEATANTLKDYSGRCKLQMEEHYLRKSKVGDIRSFRQRLERAIQSIDFESLAVKLLDTKSRLTRRINKHDDVNDGVRL